jgi:hypothetical protein
MEEKRKSYRDLVRKHDGKRQFRRLGPRWEDNIKLDLE